MHTQAGSDENGNIFIPMAYSQAEVPFKRWQLVTELVFQSDGPIVVQSVIITHNGEVFVQYAKETNSTDEYPVNDEVTTYTAEKVTPPVVEGSLVFADEKRSYE